MTLTSVDLPAPLAPIRPRISPRARRRSTSSSATRPANDTQTPFVSRAPELPAACVCSLIGIGLPRAPASGPEVQVDRGRRAHRPRVLRPRVDVLDEHELAL